MQRWKVYCHLRVRLVAQKTVQVSPAQTTFRIVQCIATEVVANEIGMLTLWIVCPAPKDLISHF